MMKSYIHRVAVCLLLILISFSYSISSSVANKDKLPVPRFVSIKFNEVNVRTGPAKDCPIEWVFIKKGEPVEIIAEYEEWRKVRDINGEGGWAHANVLSGHRFVVITASNLLPMLGSPGKYDDIIAKLSPGLRCSLKKCKQDWCLIKCKEYKGWVSKKHLWGIYPEE